MSEQYFVRENPGMSWVLVGSSIYNFVLKEMLGDPEKHKGFQVLKMTTESENRAQIAGSPKQSFDFRL